MLSVEPPKIYQYFFQSHLQVFVMCIMGIKSVIKKPLIFPAFDLGYDYMVFSFLILQSRPL